MAGRDRLCSQCGPVASVMSQAANHVNPTTAAIAAAVCTRPRIARGEGASPMRARCAREPQDERPDDDHEGKIKDDSTPCHAPRSSGRGDDAGKAVGGLGGTT